MKVTSGNTLTVADGATVGSYVISAQNSGSTKGAGQCVVYNSALGGLQSGFSAC
jgi:hypothetical protein